MKDLSINEVFVLRKTIRFIIETHFKGEDYEFFTKGRVFTPGDRLDLERLDGKLREMATQMGKEASESHG